MESNDFEYCQADYGIPQTNTDFGTESPAGGGRANGMAYSGLFALRNISEEPKINEFCAVQTFTEGSLCDGEECG